MIKRATPQRDRVNKSNKESASKKAVFPSNPSKGMSEWRPNRRNK
jgi:hypothetical protein